VALVVTGRTLSGHGEIPDDAVSFMGFFAVITLPYLPLIILRRRWVSLCTDGKEASRRG
jgi:hypothetical protein